MIYGQPITFGGASGEIDITDNGTFDVKKYATANVNVAPVLLWTNASPTSAFAAQTVTVASGYDAYLLEYQIYNTDYRAYEKYIAFLPFGVSSKIIGQENSSYAYYRAATANSGSIAFTTAYRIKGSYNSDGYAVPTRIWGVKGTIS